VKPVQAGFTPIRVPTDLTLTAAARLIGDGTGARHQAARRMMTAAAVHGIDLSLMWATVDRKPDGGISRIREVCLAVPGTGRTAVLMLGDPESALWSNGHQERAGCVTAACRHLEAGRTVRLAQSLPEPRQEWAVDAFADAGFMKVGDLAYLRRGVQPLERAPSDGWPAGITVRNVRGMRGGDEDRLLMLEALERTYVDTLDCPELCGMRETADVLESHQSTGEWSARLWWLVFKDGEPQGCMLFNRVPEQGSVELVYLGLSPALRGQRLGQRLIELGLESALRTDATQVTCAVDLRNAPAQKLYARLGFQEFGRRVAMVRPIAAT
jgi:ribosomal protein S18 acetylase RimI-like enzyme